MRKKCLVIYFWMEILPEVIQKDGRIDVISSFVSFDFSLKDTLADLEIAYFTFTSDTLLT